MGYAGVSFLNKRGAEGCCETRAWHSENGRRRPAAQGGGVEGRRPDGTAQRPCADAGAPGPRGRRQGPTASVPGFSAFQNPATNKGRVCGASEWAWKLLNVRMHGVERRGRSEEAEAELGKRRGAGRQGARASLELGGARTQGARMQPGLGASRDEVRVAPAGNRGAC